MHKFLQHLILFSLLFVVHITMAQVKFSASVSAALISKNEFVQLKLTVENAQQVQQITPPALNNFSVVSGPNQESGMTMINGDVKQYIAVSYILKPNGPGSFVIASAIAKADGREYKSNKVTVQVTNTLAANNANSNNLNAPFGGGNPFEERAAETPFTDNILRKGENATEKINRNIFIKLDLNKTSCYVGEPVIATYKLYTRLKSEGNLVKNPSFNGFSVIDLQQPDNVNYKREKINGREYNVYIIRKAQLYPLQAGNLELEAAEIENNVYFIKAEYANKQNNTMGDLLREFTDASIPAEEMEIHKVTLQSKPATVLVKPLPDVKIPTGFNGAVGNFNIVAMLQKNNLTTDDAGNLKVIISGAGNLQLINIPEVKWPNGFDVFDPKANDDFLKTAVPVSGQKIIDYSFTIAQPGSYTIPPIYFSYFNPTEGKYKADSTQPILFTVTKGTSKKNIVTTTVKKEDGIFNTFFSNRRRVISLVATLILCGLIFWLKQDRKKEQLPIEKIPVNEMPVENFDTAIVEEINYLEKAATLLHGDSTIFYKELNLALKNYLAKKLHLPLETINKKNIVEALDQKNIAVSTSIQLQQIMNEIELQLYTPFAQNEKMQQLYNDTATIIQLLDTYKF